MQLLFFRIYHIYLRPNMTEKLFTGTLESIKQSTISIIMSLSFQTDKSGQTVQTLIRLLLEEQSDQGLQCLLFHLHNFDKISLTLVSSFEF